MIAIIVDNRRSRAVILRVAARICTARREGVATENDTLDARPAGNGAATQISPATAMVLHMRAAMKTAGFGCGQEGKDEADRGARENE